MLTAEISKGKKIQDFWREISNRKRFILPATEAESVFQVSCSLSRWSMSPLRKEMCGWGYTPGARDSEEQTTLLVWGRTCISTLTLKDKTRRKVCLSSFKKYVSCVCVCVWERERERDRERQKKGEGKGQRMWVCKPWGGDALESKWRPEYKEFSNYYLHKKSDTTNHSESAVRLAA